jgi:hypothetical protein
MRLLKFLVCMLPSLKLPNSNLDLEIMMKSKMMEKTKRLKLLLALLQTLKLKLLDKKLELKVI